MDEKELIRRLEEEAGMFEIVKLTSFRGSNIQAGFKGYMENKAGENVEITVEVLHAGEEAGASRYAISAYSKDGKEVHGNGAATLEEAIPIVHWCKLD